MTRIILLLFASALLVAPSAHARKPPMPHPDFTQGDHIPEGATHDWTLGATGARGWIYSNQLETTKARQIYITEVAKGSPADGTLEVGDVVLGIGKDPFVTDPRVTFAKALTAAESAAGQGELNLLRWRAGDTTPVTVKLPVLGTYSPTAPYNCPKSKLILEQGCKTLAERIQQEGYNPSPISRSLNALALLASGDESYLPVIRQEAEWASNYKADGFQVWYYGYVVSFLAEYVMATGDESVMPGLKRLVMEAVKGQSIVGSWGHRFAGKDGRLVGYGMMNAPGVTLTISLVLAQKAGVDDPKVTTAIERSAKLLRFYIGKGAVPYGDHHPWIKTHEDNGKCGMAAVLFNLLEEPQGARFFSRMSLAAHGSTRDTGHTGNFWNITWAMPGVVQSGPNASGAWMHEFGAWYFDLARNHNGTFLHQGPPQAKPDHTYEWDATGAYLLAYAMPLKKLILTGREPATTAQLNAAQASAIIDDGRGWTNSDHTSAYDQIPDDVLIERLSSWSPVVRERAAAALARRNTAPIQTFISMLSAPKLETRLGACQALAQFGDKAAPAVPALRETLKADDLWLRVKAADALAAIGPAARSAAEDLLKMLIRTPDQDDPRAMEQRYLCFALFSSKTGLLGQSLEGIDHKLLFEAIRVGMQNQDGRARGNFVAVFDNLSEADHMQLLPELHRAVVEPAPSGIMFANQIRMAALELLTKYQVKEGLDACVFYLGNQNPWASEHRTPMLLENLLKYGAHAKPMIPELEKIAAKFDAANTHFPAHLDKLKAQMVRDAIETIQAFTEMPKLISIH